MIKTTVSIFYLTTEFFYNRPSCLLDRHSYLLDMGDHLGDKNQSVVLIGLLENFLQCNTTPKTVIILIFWKEVDGFKANLKCIGLKRKLNVSQEKQKAFSKCYECLFVRHRQTCCTLLVMHKLSNFICYTFTIHIKFRKIIFIGELSLKWNSIPRHAMSFHLRYQPHRTFCVAFYVEKEY